MNLKLSDFAALTDNPNVADKNGSTTIHYAVMKGHLEVVTLQLVRYLATFTDNPNVADNYGTKTFIHIDFNPCNHNSIFQKLL